MLNIQNLHVRAGGKNILNGLSLEVKAGEVQAHFDRGLDGTDAICDTDGSFGQPHAPANGRMA